MERGCRPDQTDVPLTPVSRKPFDQCSVQAGSPAGVLAPPALPATPMTPYVRTLAEAVEAEKRPGLRPFLALAPRLWLSAFNPALLPPIFTIMHLAQTRSSTAELAASLRDSVLEACQGVAKGAASLQTIPRYLAMQTNEQTLKATRATVLGTGLALIYCVQAIDAVVNFIVDTYRSLLLCTIQLIVQGTLEVLIGAVRDISAAVTSSLNAIRTGILDDIAAANALVKSALGGVSSVLSRIGINFDVPEMSIPKLSWLENVTIPTDFEDSLIKLNSSMPDLNDIREKMNEILDIPLQLLIKEINTTRLEIAAGLNDTIYPVPSLYSLEGENAKSLQDTLCGDMDTSLIDNTSRALYNLGTAAILALAVFVVAAWAALAFWQWRRWRALKDAVEAIEGEWATVPRHNHPDAWAVVAIVDYPMLERYSRPVFDRFNLSSRSRNNIRWLLSYLSHPTCLTLLIMSVVGLIAIQCQLLALDALRTRAESQAQQNINLSTTDVAVWLNAVSVNASRQYSVEMNTVITNLEDSINSKMFGPWINGTAVTLNNTIVAFYADVENILKVTFGGTILFNPINNFLYCVLGSKVDNLEKGLTWVSEHAHVTLPRVSEDVLLISEDSSKELAEPLASAVAGGSGDGEEGVIGKLVGYFENALRAELLVYGALLGVYAVILAVGVAVVIWHSGLAEKHDAWRKARYQKRSGSGGRNPSSTRRGWQWSDALPYLTGNKAKEPSHSDSEKGDSRPSSRASIAHLAAPGQAFLQMQGLNQSSEGRNALLQQVPPLVAAAGSFTNRALRESGTWGVSFTSASAMDDSGTGTESARPGHPSAGTRVRDSWKSTLTQSLDNSSDEVSGDTFGSPRNTAPDTKGNRFSSRLRTMFSWQAGGAPAGDDVHAVAADKPPTHVSELGNPCGLVVANPGRGPASSMDSESVAGYTHGTRTPDPETRRVPPVPRLPELEYHTGGGSGASTLAGALASAPGLTLALPQPIHAHASPSGSHPRTPVSHLLLPAVERRKRERENTIEPFTTPERQHMRLPLGPAAGAQNPFLDDNPFNSPLLPPCSVASASAGSESAGSATAGSAPTDAVIAQFPCAPRHPSPSLNPFADRP